VSETANQLPTDIDALQALVETARAERDAAIAARDHALSQMDRLRHLLRQLQRAQFGRRSEKLDPPIHSRSSSIGMAGRHRSEQVVAITRCAHACPAVSFSSSYLRNIGALRDADADRRQLWPLHYANLDAERYQASRGSVAAARSTGIAGGSCPRAKPRLS
jgi:hypothetical protein